MANVVPLVLTPKFEQSYLAYGKYPLNLVSEPAYGRASLRIHRKRYSERQKTLCVGESQVKLPVRDVSIDGKVTKQNIFDTSQLKQWLGDTTTPDPLHPSHTVGHLATKPDPRCRFIFLTTQSQTAPLQVTADFLSRILTWHQVMPGFLDFLYVYGTPFGEDREIRYSGFRTEKVLANPAAGNVLPDLGRSGRRFQVCYNLKTVALKKVDEEGVIDKSWKIRQAAIHHQFDLGDRGCQLWMFGDPHRALKDRVQELYPEGETHQESFGTFEQTFRSSLDVHLLCGRWSTEEWRVHIQSLEEIVDNLTSHVLLLGDKTRRARLESGSVGSVQQYEDMTNDAAMVLESNADIMKSLRDFYKQLVEDADFPSNERARCQSHVRIFALQMDELIYDTRMHAQRAKILVKVAADRKTLLIQHLQAQAAARQEDFAATMWRQAERSGYEAIAMRIITVITLVYLPPTFSSTFFSTDVVKYQNGDGGAAGSNTETRSSLALQRWLEVSLPLMALTFVIAGGWFVYETRKLNERGRQLKKKYPEVFSRMMEM